MLCTVNPIVSSRALSAGSQLAGQLPVMISLHYIDKSAARNDFATLSLGESSARVNDMAARVDATDRSSNMQSLECDKLRLHSSATNCEFDVIIAGVAPRFACGANRHNCERPLQLPKAFCVATVHQCDAVPGDHEAEAGGQSAAIAGVRIAAVRCWCDTNPPPQ